MSTQSHRYKLYDDAVFSKAVLKSREMEYYDHMCMAINSTMQTQYKYLVLWRRKYISDEGLTIKKRRILFSWNWRLGIVIRIGLWWGSADTRTYLSKNQSILDWFGPLIPNFDTIRKSWNDFCSMSVIFLFQPQLHLKSRPGSNSQSQSFPYISSSFLASVSSNGSIPYHFSLISGIHQPQFRLSRKIVNPCLESKTFRNSALKWLKRNKDSIPKPKTTTSKPR